MYFFRPNKFSGTDPPPLRTTAAMVELSGEMLTEEMLVLAVWVGNMPSISSPEFESRMLIIPSDEPVTNRVPSFVNAIDEGLGILRLPVLDSRHDG